MSVLDDLADFLLARGDDPGSTAAQRAGMRGLVAAYRAGIVPEQTESALRWQSLAFVDHADYRQEWRPDTP